MTELISIFVLGFVLGIKHAFDPDHVVAVSTIVNEYRRPLRAVWVGVSWGLGHTTTLLIVGLPLLLFEVSLSETAALSFEFLVGLVLVLLGLQAFWSLRRAKIHIHSHEHPDEKHVHFHSHARIAEHEHHPRPRWNSFARSILAGLFPANHVQSGMKTDAMPLFRLKSYVVGTIHGLAGSAALMLLVVASLKSTWAGMTYILLFGIGSVASMGLVTLFLSMPFSMSSRLPKINRMVQGAAATVGIVFGLGVMYQVGVVEGLLV